MKRKTFVACGLALQMFLGFALGLASPASAQEARATLKGRVVGEGGSAVAGVSVKLALQGSDQPPRAETTSGQGEYQFGDVTPGVYKVTVEAAGYKSIVLEDVELVAGDVQELRFTLEPGSADETINITPDVHPTPAPTPTPTPLG